MYYFAIDEVLRNRGCISFKKFLEDLLFDVMVEIVMVVFFFDFRVWGFLGFVGM